MLTTLLSSIQSQLTGSKSYLLTALFPVSVFLLASAALLYRISPMFRAWTSSPESGGVTEVTLVAIAWLTLAYLLSALGPLPLEVLEGKHPPISWLAPSLCARHWKLRRELNEAYIQAVREDGGYERRDATW